MSEKRLAGGPGVRVARFFAFRGRGPSGDSRRGRRRGVGESACALRCLAQRWLKILWKMWQTHTPYDPEYHARNQQRHGSWVLQLNPKKA